MKVYISADIEGITGISHWDEAGKSKPEYQEFRQRMTDEVLAACEGALAAGATEIWIKDAHGTGRNIIDAELPECARLIRGWSGSPLIMVQELDASFDAIVFIGYHSKAGSEGNPLAHTLSLNVAHLKLNGVIASEFVLHAYAAAMMGVPIAFLSSDKGLCEEVQALNEHIQVLAVSEGIGNSTVSLAPRYTRQKIKEGVADALQQDLALKKLTLPDHFSVEIKYKNPTSAYKASYYPGAEHIGEQTVRFCSDDYFEIMRMVMFTFNS